MDRDEFHEMYPRVFHMAADGSWPSIQDHGLLSTVALLDLYRPSQQVREEILGTVRKRSYVLKADGLPPAIVRDQHPLKFIDRCLLPGVSVQDFLDALNGRVFFWVSEARLGRLMQARSYRRLPQTVLTIDTAALVAARDDAALAPYNTGSVHVPNMPARGPETFVPIDQYDYPAMVHRRGAGDAIVELTLAYSAPRISEAVIKVERWENGLPTATLFGS